MTFDCGNSPVLSVKSLTKRFDGFTLDNVSFDLPAGYIMGFIGRNGAGKSTTLKSIMRYVIPDGGEVKIFGRDMAANEQSIKQDVCFAMGAFDSFIHAKAERIAAVYGSFYRNWSYSAFKENMSRFSIDRNKKVGEMSAGMRVKFAVALALSHNSKLFIFDEPTSGLDPVAREEMLDLFASIIEEGDKSILFSTHITSDLDKCADYIAFIRDGKLILCDTKDNILNSHALISGGAEDLTDVNRAKAIGVKTTDYNYTALVKRDDLPLFKYDVLSPPNLEDVTVYYNRGGNGNA